MQGVYSVSVGTVLGQPQGTSSWERRMHCGWGQKAGVATGHSLLVAVLVTVGHEETLSLSSARTEEARNLAFVMILH